MLEPERTSAWSISRHPAPAITTSPWVRRGSDRTDVYWISITNQLPDNCSYPAFMEARSCCPNPLPPPVMLRARPSPGATRSARPPGPGTPSGPTSVTGPAFTAGPRSRGSTCPGAWRPPSATTWSAWRRTASAWPPSGRPGRPSSRAPSWRGGPIPAAPASRR